MASAHLMARLKLLIPFYRYLTSGAKVDAALNFISSSQRPIGASSKNPADIPVHISDAIFVFDFEREYDLVLTNASGNPAYNLRLENAGDIFSRHTQLAKNFILKPGESTTVKCWFIDKNVHAKGSETNDYHQIPSKKKKRILMIEYDNEARTHFYTRFEIDDRATVNEYL